MCQNRDNSVEQRLTREYHQAARRGDIAGQLKARNALHALKSGESKSRIGPVNWPESGVANK